MIKSLPWDGSQKIPAFFLAYNNERAEVSALQQEQKSLQIIYPVVK